MSSPSVGASDDFLLSEWEDEPRRLPNEPDRSRVPLGSAPSADDADSRPPDAFVGRSGVAPVARLIESRSPMESGGRGRGS